MTNDPRIEAVVRILCDRKVDRYHLTWADLTAIAIAAIEAADAAAWRPIDEVNQANAEEVLMHSPELGMAVWPANNTNGLGWNVTHFRPLPAPPEGSDD